jgi:hypothetical protein
VAAIIKASTAARVRKCKRTAVIRSITLDWMRFLGLPSWIFNAVLASFVNKKPHGWHRGASFIYCTATLLGRHAGVDDLAEPNSLFLVFSSS